jgi:hypothetical protein
MLKNRGTYNLGGEDQKFDLDKVYTRIEDNKK